MSPANVLWAAVKLAGFQRKAFVHYCLLVPCQMKLNAFTSPDIYLHWKLYTNTCIPSTCTSSNWGWFHIGSSCRRSVWITSTALHCLSKCLYETKRITATYSIIIMRLNCKRNYPHTWRNGCVYSACPSQLMRENCIMLCL